MTHDAKIEEKGIKSKPYFCKDKAYFCKDEPLIFISAPKPKKLSRSKRKKRETGIFVHDKENTGSGIRKKRRAGSGKNGSRKADTAASTARKPS